MFFVLITFKTIDLWYDSILSKKRSVDLMKKHGFYYVYVVFWLFDNLIEFWPLFFIYFKGNKICVEGTIVVRRKLCEIVY
jgi:hypothetical protein